MEIIIYLMIHDDEKHHCHLFVYLQFMFISFSVVIKLTQLLKRTKNQKSTKKKNYLFNL